MKRLNKVNSSLPGNISDRLMVFVSSKMKEFTDARAEIERSLCYMHMDAFVYEHTAGARSQNITYVSLSEVEKADVFVGLFSDCYGDVTIKEFQHARALGIPCLIYIRRNYNPEPKLKEFLTRYVLHPDEGLTYDFFENSVELGNKVGQDIMRLLVQAYRNSSRQLPIDSISPSLKLVWDAIDWYKALGYKLIDEPITISDRARHFSVTTSFKVPGFGLVSQDVRVFCISGLIEADEVREIYVNIEEAPEKKTQVISDVAISPTARKFAEEKENLCIMTFDELLEQTIRFEEYFNWLESEIKKRDIDKKYITLSCTKWEEIISTVTYSSNPSWPEEEGGIDLYTEYWLKEIHKEHLSILGEFGTGKTWFIYHLAWICLSAYRSARDKNKVRPRIPLVIPLRDFAKAVEIESLFSTFFFRKHNIGMPNYEAFKQLNRMGKLLLLFDGFDEMAARIDKQKMINNFWEFARVLVPGGKVILTCRTEHFPDAKEGRALLNSKLMASTSKLTCEPPQFEVIELDMFSTNQIKRVLKIQNVAHSTQEKILSNDKLLDLAKRPLMLEYVLDAIPDVESGAPVDLSRIYLYAIRSKMKKDILQERTFTSMADKLFFLCEIAWEMLSTDKMKLNYREFPDRLRNLFGKEVQDQKDLDHWHYDMMGQAMLIRDEDGNYSPAHRSLLEFFVAYKFIAELGCLSSDFTNLARDSRHIDYDSEPRDYSWSQYFKGMVNKKGKSIPIAPLRSFQTEKVECITDQKSYVTIDKLPPNSLSFAACMVSNEAEVLNRLCKMAWEKKGLLANNVLCLIPFLKDRLSDVLALRLVNESKGRPLTYGVGWVLGELGENIPAVTTALVNTAKAFYERRECSDIDWWQTGFALEKIGFLGPRKSRQGNEAVEFLIEYLPPEITVDKSIDNLKKAIIATDHTIGRINQAEIIAIVKNEHRIDSSALFNDILSLIDFASDEIRWRCYFVVWLCGHLQIKESIPSLLLACNHSQSAVRNCAAESLGKIGVLTKDISSALEKMLKDSYYRARYHAAWSIAELKSTNSIKYLENSIKAEDVLDVKKEMIRACKILKTT